MTQNPIGTQKKNKKNCLKRENSFWLVASLARVSRAIGGADSGNDPPKSLSGGAKTGPKKMAEIENLSAIADKLPIRGTFSQLIFQIPLRDMLFLPQNTTNITFCSLIIW